MTESGYFFEYMRGLLGDRYGAFIDAYNNKPRHKALRVNTLKISPDAFIALCGKSLERNPLCECSYYCDVKPSLDPLYHAGLYYMQEPSASAAVAAFEPFIGERVLDLCAAPGGKTTQAASLMHGGILFSNDPEFKRTRALIDNAERLGVRNAVITCNTAADYRKAGFDGYFDTLIADVPCSGGGMMRYESVPYTKEIAEGCALRQREILKDAVRLLCKGGYMLYSTCTFAREENEDNIEYLRSLGMVTADIPLRTGEERGIGVPDARRIYPMNFDGEGHFYCVLRKTTGMEKTDLPLLRKKRTTVKFNKLSLDVCKFGERTVLPIEPPELEGLNVVRMGTPVYDGDAPSYALVHALGSDEVAEFGAVELGDRACDYISGMELDMDPDKRGLIIATRSGYAVGLVNVARSGNGEFTLKNKYPKYLRVNLDR